MATDFLNEKTYVDQAEGVIKKLKEPFINRDGKRVNPQLVSSSKIRNILSMAADIYDKSLQHFSNELDSDLTSRIDYLRVRIVYECGRDEKGVKKFVNESHLIDYLKMIGNNKSRYILFYRYLEAIVAFHRYYGGKDN